MAALNPAAAAAVAASVTARRLLYLSPYNVPHGTVYSTVYAPLLGAVHPSPVVEANTVPESSRNAGTSPTETACSPRPLKHIESFWRRNVLRTSLGIKTDSSSSDEGESTDRPASSSQIYAHRYRPY